MAKQRKKSSRSQEAHEAKCLRCGQCCRDKYLINDRMFFAAEGACEHWNRETRLCEIYGQRQELNPQCLSVKDGIAIGVFPANCPYVKDLPDYVPPVDQEIDAGTLRLVDRGQIATTEALIEHLKTNAKGKKSRRRRQRK